MSSKRVFTTTVNYAELFKRCPKEQIHYLQRVQNLARSYVDKINSLPDGLPKIDWDYYRRNVRPDYVPMVEDFEKKYAEFQVPYPENLYVDAIEQLTKEVEEDIRVFKQKSDVRIAYYECMACQLLDAIPYEQMTMEDFAEAFPDYALDPINRPTFWPHTSDEQLKPPSIEMEDSGKKAANSADLEITAEKAKGSATFTKQASIESAQK